MPEGRSREDMPGQQRRGRPSLSLAAAARGGAGLHHPPPPPRAAARPAATPPTPLPARPPPKSHRRSLDPGGTSHNVPSVAAPQVGGGGVDPRPPPR
ncbi:hypothetical protein NL676_022484 [Syzygium grande]|nr:hypothetical protein NL676_022484 [Syzygium grande]